MVTNNLMPFVQSCRYEQHDESQRQKWGWITHQIKQYIPRKAPNKYKINLLKHNKTWFKNPLECLGLGAWALWLPWQPFHLECTDYDLSVTIATLWTPTPSSEENDSKLLNYSHTHSHTTRTHTRSHRRNTLSENIHTHTHTQTDAQNTDGVLSSLWPLRTGRVRQHGEMWVCVCVCV